MWADGTSASYCLDRSAVIDQTDVASAAFDLDATQENVIEFTLHDASAQRFREATRKRIGSKIGVILDGRLVSVATVEAATEQLWITGLPRKKAESVIQAFQRGSVARTPAPLLPERRVTSAQPDGNGVYRIGAGISLPIPIRSREPEYTARARAARIQGVVIVDTVIGADGVVGDIHVSRSLAPDLDAKAIECVRGWRFRPGIKDGKPVPVRASIQVNFHL